MNCPTCETELGRVEYEDTSVFQCADCHGYMVDLQHMVAIRMTGEKDKNALQLESQAWPRRDDSKPIRCPRCHSKMRTSRINEAVSDVDEILIDECGLCRAVWFDPGELALMQLDYERVQKAIAARKHLSIQRNLPELESEFQFSLEDTAIIEAENNATMLSDIFTLFGIIGAGVGGYFLKAYDFDLLAGIAFVFITFIIAWAVDRFISESDRPSSVGTVVGVFIAIFGLIISTLVWLWPIGVSGTS